MFKGALFTDTHPKTVKWRVNRELIHQSVLEIISSLLPQIQTQGLLLAVNSTKLNLKNSLSKYVCNTDFCL